MKIINIGQEDLASEGRGTGCSRSGVFWTRSQEGEGAKIRSERSHEGGANVAAAICRFPALNFSFVNLIPSIFMVKIGAVQNGFLQPVH